tara:strand:- start:493 stop:1239 length:747 start_codon:yes stop_codon:yes gene_type:complete
MTKKVNTTPKWEMKDRTYYLVNGKSPLTYTIKSKGIFWFDEDKGFERELKYTVNQKTCFVDEFKGDARLGHIVFEDGILNVPKEKQNLQKLMSIYHPDNGTIYAEFDAEQEAEDDLDILELEIEALTIAKSMDIDQAEAVIRSEVGSEVSKMTSKEIKRDLLLFAKNEPKLFLELANDDDINIRNMAIKASELGILRLSDDQRTFKWAKTDKKIMTVPFDEHPYSAFTAFLKTDEGLEVYKSIEKRLK